MNSPRPNPRLAAGRPQTDLVSAVAVGSAAVACSPGDSVVGTFSDDEAPAAAVAGWSSGGGCSTSVAAGRVFGTDDAADDGWNLPKSSLINEKPANSS